VSVRISGLSTATSGLAYVYVFNRYGNVAKSSETPIVAYLV
jgi:hypothetical protein